MKLSMQYGYIRVSSKEQNEERQYIAMREFGIQNENIILDKQSGKNFERPGYIQLTGKLSYLIMLPFFRYSVGVILKCFLKTL